MVDPRTRKRVRRRLARRRAHQKLKNKTTWFVMALASIFWAIVGFELYYVDPELVENIPLMRWFLPFLIPLWLAIFFTGLTTKNTWQRSSIYTSAITFYIWLRLVDINNVFSLLILILLVFVIETAWLGEQTPKKSNKNPPLPKRG